MARLHWEVFPHVYHHFAGHYSLQPAKLKPLVGSTRPFPFPFLALFPARAYSKEAGYYQGEVVETTGGRDQGTVPRGAGAQPGGAVPGDPVAMAGRAAAGHGEALAEQLRPAQRRLSVHGAQMAERRIVRRRERLVVLDGQEGAPYDEIRASFCGSFASVKRWNRFASTFLIRTSLPIGDWFWNNSRTRVWPSTHTLLPLRTSR